MNHTSRGASRGLLCLAFLALLLPAREVAAQTLTGTLTGTVKDEQGGVLSGAVVRVASRELMGGGERRVTTDERGFWRLLVLPPGSYTLIVELLPKFKAHHEEGIAIGAGSTIDRPVILTLASFATPSRSRRPRASHATAAFPRDSETTTSSRCPHARTACSTRSRVRRACRRRPRRAAPSTPCRCSDRVSTRTSSSSTAPTSRAPVRASRAPSRSRPSSRKSRCRPTGASVEYGNVQGGVFNVVTKQGGDRYGTTPRTTLSLQA